MHLYDLALHGVVSSTDTRRLGLDAYALRSMVRRGELHHLIRGWYAVRAPGVERPPWEGTDPFDTARRQHQLVTAALLRSFDGRVVASHQSALVLHGARLWRADLETVHLCRTQGSHSRHRALAVIHPSTGEPAVAAPNGLLTVPLATAIVQVGLYPPQNSRARWPLESLIAADSALHDNVVTQGQIAAAVHSHAGHPGIQLIRELLSHADGRHESAGETRLAHVMRTIGYSFTAQVWVNAGGQWWRVDFMLEGEPVVVEFDGLAKYAGGVSSPSPAQLRHALATEKWREDRLREAGNEVVRVVWDDLDKVGLIRERIDQARSRARRTSDRSA